VKMTYTVAPITPEAASHALRLRGRVAPIGVPAALSTPASNAPWTTFQGSNAPAVSLTQRMALVPTNDIRGVDVFDDDVSGSRKWSPPV
jgi:hypothetical protein